MSTSVSLLPPGASMSGGNISGNTVIGTVYFFDSKKLENLESETLLSKKLSIVHAKVTYYIERSIELKGKCKSSIDWLNEKFSTTRCVAVVGLPGSGKTQICRDFLDIMQKEGYFVREINASSIESILNAYKKIFRDINNLSIIEFERAAFSLSTIVEEVQGFFQALAKTQKIFLFFDGLFSLDVGEINGLPIIPLEIDNVLLLISSLNSNIVEDTLPILGFTQSQTKMFLHDICTGDEAIELYKTFSGLPLGIMCAKLYLTKNKRTSVYEYIRLLESNIERKSVEDFEDALMVEYYKKEKGYRSQLAACRILILQLDKQSVDVLKYCAFLSDNTIIPFSLLEKVLHVKIETLNVIMKQLTDKSLIVDLADDIVIHRVVQQATLTLEDFSARDERSIYLNNLIVESDILMQQARRKADSAFLYDYGPHFIRMLHFGMTTIKDNIITEVKLLVCVADYYGRINNYRQKINHLLLAENLIKDNMDELSQQVLSHVLTNMAEAYRAAGEYQNGKKCVMKAFELKKKFYPDTPSKYRTNQLFLARLIIELYLDDASENLKEAKDLLISYQEVHVATEYQMGLAKIEMGRIALLEGNILQACTDLRCAREFLGNEDHSPKYTPASYAMCLRYLGQALLCHEKNKQPANLEPIIAILKKSIYYFKQNYGREDCVSVALTICIMVEIYKYNGDQKELFYWIDKAKKIFSIELTENHPDVKRFKKQIESVELKDNTEPKRSMVF